jgi:hypothetical protein
MMEGENASVGRVLRSTTANFTIGRRELTADGMDLTPRFGSLVKAEMRNRELIYGLIYCVTIEDDAFVRQLVAAGVDQAEIIEDQRQKRQVPVVVDVLIVGYGNGREICQRLPPQPPRTLDPVMTCNNAEIVGFAREHDWLRIVLNSQDAPADQLTVAALRAAAEARPSQQERETYLIGAGRELARLLSLDLVRLEGILKQLRM